VDATNPVTLPVLKLGDQGQYVQLLSDRLRDGGFGPLNTSVLGADLEAEVVYFQQTHLGPDGSFLNADGTVGPKTWWALLHPTGPAQRSNLPSDRIPIGTPEPGQQILQVALAEQRKGVCELPDGSNHSPDIDKYLPDWAKIQRPQGPPWCCFFYSWVCKTALGYWPLGLQVGGCLQAISEAQHLGLWTPVPLSRNILESGAAVYPGDAFVMNRGKGHGHIGFVYRVSPGGTQINTVEGNCGNRVKVGMRDLHDDQIAGFIRSYGNRQGGFELGLVDAPSLGTDGTT